MRCFQRLQRFAERGNLLLFTGKIVSGLFLLLLRRFKVLVERLELLLQFIVSRQGVGKLLAELRLFLGLLFRSVLEARLSAFQFLGELVPLASELREICKKLLHLTGEFVLISF